MDGYMPKKFSDPYLLILWWLLMCLVLTAISLFDGQMTSIKASEHVSCLGSSQIYVPVKVLIANGIVTLKY